MFELASKIWFSVGFWKIAIPSFIAIILAFIFHQLSISRQIKEQRRKQKIDYLIEAFSSLMMFSKNPDETEAIKHLRSASMKIQFLGSKEQDLKMKSLIECLKENRATSLDPLLCSLRDELRFELSLEKIDGNVYWIHPPGKPEKVPHQNLVTHSYTTRL